MYARKVAKNYKRKYAGLAAGNTQVCKRKACKKISKELGQTECKKSIKQLLKKCTRKVARK